MNIDSPKDKMKVDQETFELFMKTGIWNADQFEIIPDSEDGAEAPIDRLVVLKDKLERNEITDSEFEELRDIEDMLDRGGEI